MQKISRRHALSFMGLGTTTAIGVSAPRAMAESAKTMPADAPHERRVFKSDRADGRFVSTAGFLQSSMKNLCPKLAFNPRMKAEEFPAWRKAVQEKLPDVLGFPENVPEQPRPVKLWSKQREGYQLQKWEAYPEPFNVVPFLVLIPDGVSSQSPAPAVMCFPGSFSSKESLAGEPELDTGKPSPESHWAANRQAWFYARRGFVSVAVENPATHETASPLRPRNEMADCGLWMGRPYLGISVFQKACILKWLAKLPCADPKNIATSGHSLGSNPADILGVLYPDLVKAVVHNDFVCHWQERAIAFNCEPPGSYHTVPGLFRWFDHTDLEAALAPCPLLFTEGGRTNHIDKIRQAYKLLDAEDQFQVFYYDKYATPASRPFDGKRIPEGITVEEYFRYANVDPAKHCFRSERAIPWLVKVFGK